MKRDKYETIAFTILPFACVSACMGVNGTSETICWIGFGLTLIFASILVYVSLKAQ